MLDPLTSLRTILLVTLFMGVQCSSLVQAQEQSLEDIQKAIKQTQEQIVARQAEASALNAALKKAEMAIANTAKELNRLQQQIDKNTKEQRELSAEKRALEQDKSIQQKVLANQIQSAFVTGNYDYAKMVFNQQDARQFERTLTYYQYLNDARSKNISQLTQLVDEIDVINTALSEKANRLTSLRQTQYEKHATLETQNTERASALTILNTKIASDTARVDALQESEQALLAAIEKAQQEAKARARRKAEAAMALTGLAPVKSKLQKPTAGRLRKLFGAKREGQVRWKGVIFNGNEGAPVKSIYRGKVLFSDWLKGFGLVTVIDHGEGYMSLYGHNQALLKQSGDNVSTGETIALVGQSGGQLTPSLYFEIRHKGKALNPVHWLSK